MSERPECYGDPDYYDPDDHSCSDDCAFFQSCGIRVARANSANSRRSLTPKNKTTRQQVIKKQKAEIIVEPETEDSYFSVLAYNSALEAIQAMADELSNSVRHVPRKSYGPIFNRKKQ